MRIIAGEARSRTIEAPKGKDTRPTLDRVRENLFNILQNRTWGSEVLDLFAGSGAIALEAVSRGAARAVLCDHDREAIRCEQKNAAALGFTDRIEIMACDWQAALNRLRTGERKFDLVFLDPLYAMLDLTQVTEQLKALLKEDALVICEHQADKPYLMADGYEITDQRRYGYVGISIYRLTDERNGTET